MGTYLGLERFCILKKTNFAMAATYSYNQMILLKDTSIVWKEWRVLISINRINVTAEKNVLIKFQ